MDSNHKHKCPVFKTTYHKPLGDTVLLILNTVGVSVRTISTMFMSVHPPVCVKLGHSTEIRLCHCWVRLPVFLSCT